MAMHLNSLRENVIFLVVGNREIRFIRFVSGKIFSSRSHKVSYDADQGAVKSFFKDYFIGKSGIPVCIIFDIPNQSFTEYSFSKSINSKAVHHSIIRKSGQDISQDAIHDYFKIDSLNKKKSDNAYQVVSLVQTSIASIYIDLLNKFPNPLAGYFSMILEMPSVCEGQAKRINLSPAIPVVKQDDFDIEGGDIDDLSIAVQFSPISGINFALYQGRRILFHHTIVCKAINSTLESEIHTTVETALSYCKQSNVGYRSYIYGDDDLLQAMLRTKINSKSLFYIQNHVSDAKSFYHKKYSMSNTKVQLLDIIASKCLYEPTFFIENKVYFATIFKYRLKKATLTLLALCTAIFFIYTVCTSSLSVLSAFTKYNNQGTLNIDNVMMKVQTLEDNVSKQRHMVDFYAFFPLDVYQHKFFSKFKALVHGTTHIVDIMYTCVKNCHTHSIIFDVSITGHVLELQDYYTLVSDVRRVFFQHEINRKIDEKNGVFSIEIIALNKNSVV